MAGMIKAIMGWLRSFSDSQTVPLRERITALEAENRKLKAQLPAISEKDIPDSEVSFIGMAAMFALVQEYKLKLTYGSVLDEDYWFPTHEWWLKIIKDLVPRIPPWVKDRRDCDGFGVMMKGLVEFYYGFNACGIMDGKVWLDYIPGQDPEWTGHDWFGFIDETGMWSVERNGEVWKTGGHAKFQEEKIYI